MGTVKGPVLYDFDVSHPEYPRVMVSSIGPDSASITVAKERWGLSTSEWAQIAASITVKRMGRTLKPRCRRCGKEIAEAGLCLDCAKIEAIYRRDAARIRSTDNRAEYRHRT